MNDWVKMDGVHSRIYPFRSTWLSKNPVSVLPYWCLGIQSGLTGKTIYETITGQKQSLVVPLFGEISRLLLLCFVSCRSLAVFSRFS